MSLICNNEKGGATMGDEVLDFANKIGATDLKTVFDYSEFHGLFKRRNYFLLDKDKFLIVKISRSKIRTFWGFNTLTEKGGNYFFVALVSDKSGWVLSKREILSQISDDSLSYSENQEQYKINNYNLKDHHGFTSIEGFLRKIGISK
jgi:hypothetical protein